MLFWYDLQDKVARRRKSIGPADVDPVLLDILEKRGLSRQRIKRLWRGIVLNDRSDIVVVERIVKGRVQVPIGGTRMSACLPLAPGVHWIEGEIRFSGKGATIPETVADLLPGRPVRDVLDHPSIPQRTTFIGRLEPYETSHIQYTPVAAMRSIREDGSCMVLETDAAAVRLPRMSPNAFGHWAWRMRRTWPDSRGDLPGRDATRKMVKVNAWAATVSSAVLVLLTWHLTHDLRTSLMQIPSAMLGSAIGGVGGYAIFAAVMLWRRPSRWQMWMRHDKWLAEELERQLF